MKKLTPHHTLTPKGGRVAARVKRHAFKTQARVETRSSGTLVPPGSHNGAARGRGLDILSGEGRA
jgi:hypothetical protein